MTSLWLTNEDGGLVVEIDSVAAACIAYHLTLNPCDSRDCSGLVSVLREFVRGILDGK